jgi:arylsulfatase
VYSLDLIAREALNFVKANKDKPFFLYVPFTIPHVALQVPEDSLAEYKGRWPDPPYDGKRGYVAHQHPRACYAAMVTRMDRYVGQIMTLLKELGLEDDTLVIFSSDNGPTYAGGSDAGFFESAGPLHGLKGSVWDGGIRVPFIARWPGRIKAGSESDCVSAFWDFLPTCAELLDMQAPAGIDGVSILPTLLGRPQQQKQHEYLYWELNGQQAVRLGDWKAVRLEPDQNIQLFDLKTDIGEKNDVAERYPQIVARMEQILAEGRTESEVFPLRKPNAAKKK